MLERKRHHGSANLMVDTGTSETTFDNCAVFRATEKGHWSDPAALKHGSAVGRPLPEVAFMP